MSTMTRKQREVKEREQMLLGLARQMLVEEGFAGLNMDRLAERAEYSKGTIYQHFSAKEDLVAALATQSTEARHELFSKAVAFRGTTRERMLAMEVVDELFARLHPHHFRSEMVIRMADLIDRASDTRRDCLQKAEAGCLAMALGLVREAVEKGELKLAEGATPEGITFGLFSVIIGTQVGVLNFPAVSERLGIVSTTPALRWAVGTFLDGLGWKPLRSEWDYEATRQRIAEEVFADECARTGPL